MSTGPGNVTYVRNITDVEDKIIDRAAERGSRSTS
jgi:cysteinyl-tRNA synthetase